MSNLQVESIKLSDSQQQAFNQMLSGKNCFITGPAGTGKSTLVKKFIDQCKKNCVVVAPTGIAAVNINGQTINSFFMLPPGLLTPDSIEAIPWKNVREKIRLVDVVVIDEISMVRSDMLQAIDLRLKECEKGKAKQKPFGGKQIIACGDFFQLPPIVSDKIEEDWLNQNIGGELAFESKIWQTADFEVIQLKQSFRQQDDKKFLNMLQKIRHGDLSCSVDCQTVLDELNNECATDKELSIFPIRLCTTNREANSVNNQMLAQIQETPEIFTAVVKGIFNEQNYPTDFELSLKPGCRVMVLCNSRMPNNTGFFYVNGDCGTVLEIKNRCQLTKVHIQLDNGNKCWIGPHEWKNMKYVVEHDRLTGKKVIRQEEIGSFTQMPLRLAYATTIHKSQGMTLDSVDIRLGNGCFAHGQLYTALSRARNLQNLRLERNILEGDLILDRRIVEFYNNLDPLSILDQPQTKSLEVPTALYEKMKRLLAQMSNNETI